MLISMLVYIRTSVLGLHESACYLCAYMLIQDLQSSDEGDAVGEEYAKKVYIIIA